MDKVDKLKAGMYLRVRLWGQVPPPAKGLYTILRVLILPLRISKKAHICYDNNFLPPQNFK